MKLTTLNDPQVKDIMEDMEADMAAMDLEEDDEKEDLAGTRILCLDLSPLNAGPIKT